MITKNINGVYEEMTQKEYEEKIERGMKLEVVKSMPKEKKEPVKKTPVSKTTKKTVKSAKKNDTKNK